MLSSAETKATQKGAISPIRANIQRMTAPLCSISHKDTIKDRVGVRRTMQSVSDKRKQLTHQSRQWTMLQLGTEKRSTEWPVLRLRNIKLRPLSVVPVW